MVTYGRAGTGRRRFPVPATAGPPWYIVLLSIGFVLQALFQIVYLCHHLWAYELKSLISIKPHLWHRCMFGGCSLVLLASMLLFIARLRGWTNIIRTATYATEGLTVAVAGAAFLMARHAENNVSNSGFWVLERVVQWGGRSTDPSYWVPSPFIGYSIFWLAFASWVLTLLPIPDRGWWHRCSVLLLAWVLWYLTPGLERQAFIG